MPSRDPERRDQTQQGLFGISDRDAGNVGDASGASTASIEAIANDVSYSLTVEQAREAFARLQRRVPAIRTMQSYCIDRAVDAQKIRTSFGAEWLINEASLLAFIERQPQLTQPAPQAPLAPRTPSVVAAELEASGDASVASGPMPPGGTSNTATATAAASDASDAKHNTAAEPIGERRTLAEVLIQNSRLTAIIEGKDAVIAGKEETIAELKDDRRFIREELVESRKLRGDVKDIATKMLETLQAAALKGAFLEQPSSNQPVRAEIIRQTDEAQN